MFSGCTNSSLETETESHRIILIERDPWNLPSPAFFSKQGQLRNTAACMNAMKPDQKELGGPIA